MSEILILTTAPVIFTKDKAFLQTRHSVKAGVIFLLPEDAVLYVPSETHPQSEELPS